MVRMETFKGIAVSPGLAIGQVFVLDDVRTRIPRRSIPLNAIEHEKHRFADALSGAKGELIELSAQAAERLGSESAKIFDFHQLMLRDRSLTLPIEGRIERDRVTAEYAVQEQFRTLADMFRGMDNETFRTKVDDVWDLERRLLKHLIGEHRSALDRLDRPAIVIARDLTPTQTASFQGKPVKGFATDLGGLTSHTAIFARALQIPAVVGLDGFSDIAEDGDPVILDGERGVLILRPDEHTLESYREAIEIARRVAVSLASLAELPAQTTDGTRVLLMGNIEFADEMQVVIDQGGDGVGLFRTEFLWLTSDHEPTEEEQYQHYTRCLSLSRGREVTFRTFDLGADKYTQERAEDPERNPFLGCRSIRYCLQNVPMFKRQLRAILRASAHGRSRIMFPLITDDLELRQARIICKDVMEDLEEEGIPFDASVPIGIMVETPAAALMAGSYAGEVSFFSIGTNDLIQYTLAVDRTNEKVQNLYSAAHPAVLKLVKDVIRAGRRHNIPVSLCGEVAGDTHYTLLLMGLGLRTLSVTPSRLPFLKRIVRSVDIQTCERLARTACSFESERQVTAYLRDQARKIIPEAFDGRSVEAGPGTR
ncbi:MAG TPA: phosphoenolpyruvate--protein phosphotransferase [Phycisphaerales bacterium]|nr:phosphoenolpyruvate--protein phosphotransferase [Phycisphaerales bacterium]